MTLAGCELPAQAIRVTTSEQELHTFLGCSNGAHWQCVQGEELEPARKKAEAAGVKDIFIDDLREEFVSDYVFPMFRCAAAERALHPTATALPDMNQSVASSQSCLRG